MSVNLNKNRESLLAAWQDVLSDKTKTDWALFGYEGQSNDLKLVSKGSNGIEELVEDFNSGKVMYAFLKVADPKTSLMKHVLINWQGEGAPTVRKGTCANHVRDISNFFKGAHLTLNARTEEEVDPDVILAKLEKSSASAYKFNERAEPTNDSGPVGTAYKRTIPKQEINVLERDRFWEKQEEEEKQRQACERQKLAVERKKTEEERVLRDSQETARREAQIMEVSKNINQIRLAEKESFERSLPPQAATAVEDLEKEELERRNRAELLKRQRSEEAQSLIAKRTVDARAVFEQNTAAGQLNHRRSSGNIQSNPVENGSRKIEKMFQAADGIDKNKPITTSVKTPPIAATNGGTSILTANGKVHPVEEEEPQDWDDEVKNEVPEMVVPVQFQNDPEPTSASVQDDDGLTAKALYDYQAADDTEINFDPGDIITHIDQIDEGWWQGLGPDGTYGLFPANYVELIK